MRGLLHDEDVRLEAMEAMGVDHVAISVTDATGARDLIEDFGREVIAKRT